MSTRRTLDRAPGPHDASRRARGSAPQRRRSTIGNGSSEIGGLKQHDAVELRTGVGPPRLMELHECGAAVRRSCMGVRFQCAPPTCRAEKEACGLLLAHEGSTQCQAKIGRFRAHVGRVRTNLGHVWSNSGQFWPIRAGLRPSLAEVGPNSGASGPGRIWPSSADPGPKFADLEESYRPGTLIKQRSVGGR